jgi:hypothetical protein
MLSDSFIPLPQPIFDAAALHCLEIGMQCHGCCVLQRCILRSRGEHREKLVVAIACNGFELAQDAYGYFSVLKTPLFRNRLFETNCGIWHFSGQCLFN